MSRSLRLLTAAALTACGLAAATSCSPSHAGSLDAGAAPSHDTVARVTSRGVLVRLPAPLVRHHPDLVAEVLRRVDSAEPERDPRIAPGTRGVPTRVTVHVLQSGAFPVGGPAPGFALGSTNMDDRMWLALRACSAHPHEAPLLPALEHELRHLLTRDPEAGH